MDGCMDENQVRKFVLIEEGTLFSLIKERHSLGLGSVPLF